MAGDTRQEPSPQATSSAAAVDNANVLSGGTTNTAGGKKMEASIVDAARTIHLKELTEVQKKPCVRDALMTGIGAGFGVGGIRAILGARVWTACNWAVGSFCFGSFLMYEYCQRKRALELQGMKRVVEVIDRKKAEKGLKAEEAKAARKKAKEES